MRTVDWFISSKCDQASHCRFCFAPWNAFPPDASLHDALGMCERLSALDIGNVVICGGEPFQFEGLDEVVRKLHRLGIHVVLYTSGTSDRYAVEQFFPYIRFLSIPIDAVSADAAQRMRGPEQLARVRSLLSRMAGMRSRPKIKIGTVVTAQNIGDLDAVGDYLRSLRLIDVWRLYQFSPYGIGGHNRALFQLPDADFGEAVVRQQTRHDGSFTISGRTRDETCGYCMIMDSEGNFYRYAEEYIPLGVTIDDEWSAIAGRYDQTLHASQKAWVR